MEVSEAYRQHVNEQQRARYAKDGARRKREQRERRRPVKRCILCGAAVPKRRSRFCSDGHKVKYHNLARLVQL